MENSRWHRTLWVSIGLVLISVEWTECENSSSLPPSKITCRVCESATSWHDCDKKSQEEACAANYDMCSNIHTNSSKRKRYSRGCSNTGTCKLLQEACSKLFKGKQRHCEVKCCHGNQCNAPVSPLHCYACRSRDSWANCDMERVKVRCSPGEDTCGKIYAPTQVTGPYAKMCMIKAKCPKLKVTCGDANKRDVSGDVCDVSCCQGNFCNTASSLQLVSGILVLGPLCMSTLKLL